MFYVPQIVLTGIYGWKITILNPAEFQEGEAQEPGRGFPPGKTQPVYPCEMRSWHLQAR
jgi:hypothetical protein